MNLDQLTYFCAAAECRNFADASELILVSPSWVSKQIASLERELGVDLFFRNPNGVRLTPAGSAFLPFARKTMNASERIAKRMTDFSDSAHLRIRLGTLPLLTEHGFTTLLADYQLANPAVLIDLRERNQEDLIQKLRLYQLDAAILRSDRLEPDEFDWIVLRVDQLAIVTALDHPLAGSPRVTLHDVALERFVLLSKESLLPQLFQAACREQGITLNVVLTHTRHEPLLSSVSRGIGITALPTKLVEQDSYYQGSVTCIPLVEDIRTDLALVWRRDVEMTDSLRSLIAAFRSYSDPLR
ncbi:MAG: LysR family transcriptional regulator [Actinomycetes bacterium]|jgi:DNA-binding transcriptional LysR family regulator|nr:LysR family transcriptional regulator [Actinomycetes bacterium]